MTRLLLVFGGGLVLLSLTYLATARLAERLVPESAPVIAALDPDKPLRDAVASYREALVTSSDFVITDSQKETIARHNPLSTIPFTPELIEASQQGDLEAMKRLSSLILRLNPRDRAARFVAAQVAVMEGDNAAAMAALDRLILLNWENREDYIMEMVQIATTEEGRALILDYVEEEPRWGGLLVRTLAREIDAPAFMLKLFEHYPAGQDSYVMALANRGELERAHLTFLNFLPAELIGKTGVPFDAKFEDLPGARPFNWTLHREFAGFEPRGGLFISFFGQGRPRIAEQVMRLSPGDYEGKFQMNGRLHANGGHLAWQVLCTRSGDEIGKIEIKELLASNTEFLLPFTVPETGCAFQTLRLAGVAGEFPRTARAMVTEARISRAVETEG